MDSLAEALAAILNFEENIKEIQEMLSECAAILDDPEPMPKPLAIMTYPSPAIHMLQYYSSGFT